ncbi:hypothetical protein LTR60_000708 [Cryomyces antarcticus]|nr:hypothetical protein LTR60_000708 [Cryomyces antarcticus]
MQKALGQSEVLFRSKEQGLAMKAILAGETPLVIVLPTGGGKTLLFTAPACLEDPGVTIVVVPFRALINDLKDRLKKVGIEHLEWKKDEVNPAAVVIVSADFAGSWGFLTYASLLDRKGLLRRVVVDECHLTYTASDYRPRLVQLKNLRTLSCPMVLLTATQPPMLENELGESMLVRGARYIRASTVRHNIRYMVQQCERGKLVETAVQMCRRQEPTSALGTGVDYAGIVFVLHVGVPYGMVDFAQESGRAGRAGELVDSVTLVEEGEVERRDGSLSRMDESAMVAFVQASGCRRKVMSGYLDGRETACSDIDCAACDRCGEGVAEWYGAQKEYEDERRQVRQVLDELVNECAACWRATTLGGGSVAAMGNGREGFRVVQRVGFKGEEGDWAGYRKWLGQRHERYGIGSATDRAAFDADCATGFKTALESVGPQRLTLPTFTTFEAERENALSIAAPFLALNDLRNETDEERAQIVLSLVVLLDQLSRNIFRDDQALIYGHYDRLSRAITQCILVTPAPKEQKTNAFAAADIHAKLKLLPSHRIWFYMPLMHSEDLADHDSFEQLVADMKVAHRGDEAAIKYLDNITDFDKKHRDILERFGRYPHRNNVLGRETSAEEREWIEGGGDTFGTS